MTVKINKIRHTFTTGEKPFKRLIISCLFYNTINNTKRKLNTITLSTLTSARSQHLSLFNYRIRIPFKRVKLGYQVALFENLPSWNEIKIPEYHRPENSNCASLFFLYLIKMSPFGRNNIRLKLNGLMTGVYRVFKKGKSNPVWAHTYRPYLILPHRRPLAANKLQWSALLLLLLLIFFSRNNTICIISPS